MGIGGDSYSEVVVVGEGGDSTHHGSHYCHPHTHHHRGGQGRPSQSSTRIAAKPNMKQLLLKKKDSPFIYKNVVDEKLST